MKISFLNSQNSHFIALIAAAFVHGSIAVWSMMPSNPIVINQQAIQVSFVAPSASDKKNENVSHKKIVLNVESENVLKQKKNDKVEKSESKAEKNKLAGKETSGRVDQNATATKSAETDPVFDAAYLNNPAPYYPQAAKRKGIQGKVMLNVIVKADGTPATVQVYHSSGFSALDEAALEAVRQWKFVPARRGGEFVQASVVVPVDFKMI
jgi:TonB family protein